MGLNLIIGRFLILLISFIPVPQGLAHHVTSILCESIITHRSPQVIMQHFDSTRRRVVSINQSEYWNLLPTATCSLKVIACEYVVQENALRGHLIGEVKTFIYQNPNISWNVCFNISKVSCTWFVLHRAFLWFGNTWFFYIIQVCSSRFAHRSPISSWCPQLCVPQPLCLHPAKPRFVSLHTRLSSQICPDPRPKPARGTRDEA